MFRMGRFAVVVCSVALFASPALAQQPAPKLEVLSHLPQDPLFVAAAEQDSLAQGLDELLGLLQRFMPANEEEGGMDVAGFISQADEMLGVSLRDDLLARIGPEIAMVVDLPPLDSLMGLAVNQSPQMIDQSFSNFGLVFQVRDQAAFEESLRTALSNLEFEATETDGVWKLAMPRASEETPEIAAYWRIEDGWMTLGAGPSWLTAAAKPRPQGQRFTSGSDFRRVMGHLDPNTTSVAYMNLPKLGQLVSSSGMIQGVLAGRPQIAEAVRWLVEDELTVGWAQTKVEMDGGVRVTAFGPEILMGGGLSLGILAASLSSNLGEAIEKAEAMRNPGAEGETGEEMNGEEMDVDVEVEESDAEMDGSGG